MVVFFVVVVVLLGLPDPGLFELVIDSIIGISCPTWLVLNLLRNKDP